MTHPSFFALDSHALDPQPGEVKTHLESCSQCQAHVAALKVTSPLPSKLEGLVSDQPAASPWWRFVALGLATAAVILSAGYGATREPPQLITAKGTPAAALWLHREGKVIVWNGQPMLAGDAVRIEVAPAGFTHVTVYDEHTRQVLYEARVADDAPTLTPAWEFDGQAASESLRVVISRGPVSPAVLQAQNCVASSEAHCFRFVLQLAPSP